MMKLPVGTEIYYSGDRANMPDFGEVTERDGHKVKVKLNDGREFAITTAYFNCGTGCNFFEADEWRENRNRQLAAMGL
jgi:hypothetical protein